MAGHHGEMGLIEFIVAALVEALPIELQDQVHGDEWIDQRRSPLISHCATVRARIEAGRSGARMDGDRYLLSTTAIAEEMANGAT